MRHYWDSSCSKMLSSRDYAVGRLKEWGACIMAVKHSTAPNPNCYSKSAFVPGVPDDYLICDLGERGERALELDLDMQWLMHFQPNLFSAAFLEYVRCRPGTRARLREKEKIMLYHMETGRSRSSYYRDLERAIDHIERELSLQQKPHAARERID